MSNPVIWLTGLPCSGKTTLGLALGTKLLAAGHNVVFLDGDMVRELLSETGFSKEDRDKHILRMGQYAAIGSEHYTVICAFVSPYLETRAKVRKMCDNFIEVWVCCPDKVCEERDTKGMWAQAQEGKIKNFTGLDGPYEAPTNAEVTVLTDQESAEECVRAILEKIECPT